MKVLCFLMLVSAMFVFVFNADADNGLATR